MDRQIEKKTFLRRYIWYIAAATALMAVLVWIVFSSTASTMAAQFRTLIVERLTGTVEGYAARAHRCQSGKTVEDWYAERECHIFAGVVLELLAKRRMSTRIHIAEERGGHAAGKRDFW